MGIFQDFYIRFFKKPIDKYVQICYNKDTEREVDKHEEQKITEPNQQGNE